MACIASRRVFWGSASWRSLKQDYGVNLLSRRQADLQSQGSVISTISGRTHGNNQSFLHLG